MMEIFIAGFMFFMFGRLFANVLYCRIKGHKFIDEYKNQYIQCIYDHENKFETHSISTRCVICDKWYPTSEFDVYVKKNKENKGIGHLGRID